MKRQNRTSETFVVPTREWLSLLLKFTTIFTMLINVSAFGSTNLKIAPGPVRLGTFPSTSVTSCFQVKSMQNGRNKIALSMSAVSGPMKANLVVALDQPVFSFQSSTKSKLFTASATQGFWKGFLTILLSDAFKTAVVAFFLALTLSIVARSPTTITSQSMKQNIRDNYRLARGKLARFFSILKSKIGLLSNGNKGTPLVFDQNDAGQGGWGVASLMAKKNVGDTSYNQYDFKLPLPEHTLPLALGQQMELCCLSNSNEVTKGGFYVSSERDKMGSFSIIAPKVQERQDGALFELGPENANLVSLIIFMCISMCIVKTVVFTETFSSPNDKMLPCIN